MRTSIRCLSSALALLILSCCQGRSNIGSNPLPSAPFSGAVLAVRHADAAELAMYVLTFAKQGFRRPRSIDEYPIGVGGPKKLVAIANYGKGYFGKSPRTGINAVAGFAVDPILGVLFVGSRLGGSPWSYFLFQPGVVNKAKKLFSPQKIPSGIAFDADHNLVEGDNSTNPDSSKMVTYSGLTPTPLATLPGVSFYVNLWGLTFDSANNSYNNWGGSGIDEFSPLEQVRQPIRTLEAGTVPGLGTDGRGYIYAIDTDEFETATSLEVFAPSSDRPVQVINGPKTGLDPVPQKTIYAGVSVDSSGRIYVARYDSLDGTNLDGGVASVLVFSGNANGDAKPLEVLKAPFLSTDVGFLLIAPRI